MHTHIFILRKNNTPKICASIIIVVHNYMYPLIDGTPRNCIKKKRELH